MSQLTAWMLTAQSLHGSMGEFATAHLLVFPQQPLALQLDTSARFVSGQPGRDSDLSSGDVAQPSAGSQLQTYLPRLAGQWGEEGTQQNLLSGGFLFLWGTVVLPLSAAKKRGFGTPGNTLFL